jgi:cyclopropane-fatty-acyl-phospholipid synthase
MIDFRSIIEKQAALADIKIGGSRPWDITVHDEGVFKRFVLDGALGLGESYVAGQWDCQRLDLFFEHLLRAFLDRKSKTTLAHVVTASLNVVKNLQNKARAFQVGEAHYDLSNEFYEAMLDSRMIYTCAFWNGTDNLDAAQESKLRMVCQKLGIESGHEVLDIGCGWGGLARYAAEEYGAHVTGVTVSKSQADYAVENCAGLPVDILYKDYRDVEGKFDRIISLGMFEHVGWRNYRTYMEIVDSLLADNGLFLLQTVGHRHTTVGADPWVTKHIFINSSIPSIKQIGNSIEDLLIMEDWHNFGPDYAKTLRAWHRNFTDHWPSFEEEHGEDFFRTWEYYLLSFVGAFDARFMQLWQIVFSKRDATRKYLSVRL